jgi:dihydrofolate reductase
MAKLVFELNQSLDGYIDHQEFAPGPALFQHFIGQVRGLTGSVYGRRMYEVMRFWDDDHPEWAPELRDFATAWRSRPKWVVSRSLKSVGSNATLVADDVETVIRELKARFVGEIEVGGPELARSLGDLGLIDEYRLYLHPVVLGRGKPFFAGPRPPLRLVAYDLIGEGTIRLTYVPAQSRNWRDGSRRRVSPLWVKLRRTQSEQMSSGLSPTTDIARCSRPFAFVPDSDIAPNKIKFSKTFQITFNLNYYPSKYGQRAA